MTRNFLSFAAVLLVASSLQAQRPDSQRPPTGRNGRPDGPPPGFRGPPGFHLMTALDTDKDGKLSGEELDNAVAALKQLDKDKDGKLSQKEIGWPPSFGGGRGGFPGIPGFGPGGFPGFGQRNQGPPQRPTADDDALTPVSQAKASATKKRFFKADQLKPLDKNGDGKISRNEIPELLRSLILERLDMNKDGAIDKAELAQLAVDQKKDQKKDAQKQKRGEIEK